jgi:hypothetical protein
MSTSRRRAAARALGALSLALTAVAATGQGAFAASRTVHDTTDDTYAVSNSDTNATPVRKPGPVSDIIWVRTAHRHKAVSVTIRARDIAPGVNSASVLIAAPKHKRYTLTGLAGFGSKQVTLTRGLNGRDIKCHGLKMQVDAKADVVRLTVPRTCIGSPRWVRTGTLLLSASGDVTSPDSEMKIDIAGMDTISDAWWNNPNSLPPLGPKVRVG